jgi:hypothetical protein
LTGEVGTASSTAGRPTCVVQVSLRIAEIRRKEAIPSAPGQLAWHPYVGRLKGAGPAVGNALQSASVPEV